MSTYIAKHFKWSEALVTDTGLPNEPDWFQKSMLVNTFRILSCVRSFCGFPLRINSAFRSSAVNKAVKGSKGSYHLDGRAADISTIGLDDKQISKLYNNLLTWRPIEIYKTDSYIHVAF